MTAKELEKRYVYNKSISFAAYEELMEEIYSEVEDIKNLLKSPTPDNILKSRKKVDILINKLIN